jgi:NAD-dependent SIR2 family protein deacetylase
MRFSAPVHCPYCGHRFMAEWVDEDEADQQCPECGTEFPAACPGFEFTPRTVVCGTAGPQEEAPRTEHP